MVGGTIPLADGAVVRGGGGGGDSTVRVMGASEIPLSGNRATFAHDLNTSAGEVLPRAQFRRKPSRRNPESTQTCATKKARPTSGLSGKTLSGTASISKYEP